MERPSGAIITPPTVTRKDVRPLWLQLPPDPSDVEAFQHPPVPHSLVPELVTVTRLPHESEPKPLRPRFVRADPKKEKQIDTSELSDDTIKGLIEAGYYPTGTPIRPVVPAFAGLRARVLDRRARRIQSKVEGLAKEQKTMHYIGERALQGKGYLSHDTSEYPNDIDRPHRLLERGPARRLDRINKRRTQVKQAAYNHATVYPEVIGKTQRFHPFFREYDKGPDGRLRRSWGERRAMGLAARKYRTNERMARIYDRFFRHIVTQPGRAAAGLPERRDKLAVKTEALRQQAETNKQRRQAYREVQRNKTNLWG